MQDDALVALGDPERLGDLRTVEAHLRDCDGCSAYLEQFRVTVRSLADLPPEPAGEHTHATLLAMFRELRA